MIRHWVYFISDISIQPLDITPENAEGKLQGITRKQVREDENSTEFIQLECCARPVQKSFLHRGHLLSIDDRKCRIWKFEKFSVITI